MTANSTQYQVLCRQFRPWLVAALSALSRFAGAQTTQPTLTPDPLAGVPVQVLDQMQVTTGTHMVTFNRIAPPVFPAPNPTPSLASQAQAHGTPVVKSATRSPKTRSRSKTNARSPHTSAAGGDQEKPYKALSISATVYDHQFSELRWYGGNTPELRVDVNMDFNLFAGVTNIETADTVYMLIFGLGNDTTDSLVQAGQQPPDLSQFPVNASAYQVVQGSIDDDPEDTAALAALCAYYDANKAQLAAAYQQRLADQAAHDQWLKDHPPVQPDTTISYWPTKNSIFLTPGQ